MGSFCYFGVVNVGVFGSILYEGMGRGGLCVLFLLFVNVLRVGFEI